MPGSPKKRARRQAEEALRSNLPALIPKPVEPKDRFGRPTLFRPYMVEMARVLCEDGSTEKELASELGIGLSTLYEWRNRHPELAAVMRLGKEIATDRLERTAYEIACGYTTTVKETVKLRDERGNERLVESEREIRVPPNEQMLWKMMKSRRPDDWKDKTETKVSGEVVHLTVDQVRERLKSVLVELRIKQVGSADEADT